MNKRPIIVIGSSNTDMVIKTSKLPQPGETILGGTFFMNAGGKGANQAVAAARLGGNVVFIAKTGNDIFGNHAVELFLKEGINTSFMYIDASAPSGVAIITVDEHGENCITVAPGANELLSETEVQAAEAEIASAEIVLIQLETPLSTVEHVAKMTAEAGVELVVNPAPAARLSDELLRRISIITPNQKEASMLTGIEVTDRDSAEKAAKILQNKGVKTIIITLGQAGALVLHKSDSFMIAAPVVQALDTTAAGDIFNGALVVAIAEKMTMRDAVSFACKAAAISVTRLGAQSSAPYRREM